MVKYFLSLCCIIKNERYLEEFIIYYRLLGVEHFYIYDNDSTIPIIDRLNNFFYKNICTIIKFPGKIQQLNAYNDFIKYYSSQTKWVIIVDGDEYILPKYKNYFSLRNFLKEYDEYHAIGINWMMFGTSFHDKIQPGFIVDNYRYCEGIQNPHIKTICKPEFVTNIESPHYVNLIDPSKYIDPYKNIISGSFNNNNTIDIIQINHYWGKSLEEHYEKRDRGRATTDKLRVICENPHLNYNKVIDNFLPDKYLNHIKKLKSIIDVNWETYKLLNLDLIFQTSDEYYNHLFTEGINDKRYYKIKDKYPNFSYYYYSKNYSDLSSLSFIDLEKHYLIHGVNENRICDRLLDNKYPIFSCEFYKKNYPDLYNLSDEELEKHYINYGINENRICDHLLNNI
jgi:hypothetical protein